MPDKIKPLKIESSSLGGTQNDPYPTETNPAQDYIATKGIAFENTDTKLFDLDASGNIQYKDATQTTYRKLNDISASGNQGDIQFRGVTAGSFSSDPKLNWDAAHTELIIGTEIIDYPDNPLLMTGSTVNYFQVNIQNTSAGIAASTDYIATADNGDDATNYVDLGINSSTYADPAFSIVGPNDAYLYANDGNIAVGSKSKDLVLFAGGTENTNEVARGSASGYFQQNWGRVHVPKIQVTSTGTAYLTSLSQSLQVFTGSAIGMIVQFPSALTVIPGHIYEIYNQSSQTIILNDGAGVAITYIPPTAAVFCILQAGGSVGGTWITYGNTIGTAAGIVNYKVTSNTPFVTASATDVVITGFTVTPTQGSYQIISNMEIQITANNSLTTSSAYKGAVQIADSPRSSQGVGSNWKGNVTILTDATFSGTQACDVRVKSSSGNVTVTGRTLLLTRLGN